VKLVALYSFAVMGWCLDTRTTFTFSKICILAFQFSRFHIVLKPDQFTAENYFCSERTHNIYNYFCTSSVIFKVSW
jgi:hypothetical protein